MRTATIRIITITTTKLHFIIIIIYTMPSMQGDNTGMCIAHIQAFPLHSRTASSWNRWTIVSEVGNPSLWPCRQLMYLMFSTASWLHPPRVSTARGIKVSPIAWQAFWCEAHSLPPTKPTTLKAWPWVTDASWIVSFCSGEITVTSRAAGLPCFQQGRYRSAGQELTPGINDHTSFLGAKTADWAADIIGMYTKYRCRDIGSMGIRQNKVKEK